MNSYSNDPIFHFNNYWDLEYEFIISSLEQYTKIRKENVMLTTLPIAILSSLVHKGLGAEVDLPLDSFLAIKLEDTPINVKGLLDEHYDELTTKAVWALEAVVFLLV
jgi:hypothetical protein